MGIYFSPAVGNVRSAYSKLALYTVFFVTRFKHFVLFAFFTIEKTFTTAITFEPY